MTIKEAKPTNFIKNIINEDIASKKHTKIKTRFPPEPNGFLHIGHAKAMCLNFGIAKDYANASCNLRFDDTNPLKEDPIYMKAIKEDVRWMGFKWDGEVRHASNYFEKLYECAINLIKEDKAFVCSLNAEEIREYRGTLKEPGRDSPDRTRAVSENLALFERMKKGEFAEGEFTLRAKIDNSSGNINLRDPVIYRILKKNHPMTGDKWCIYPTYDYTHCLSDAFEGITHSLCTIEFEDHRPLYDWVIKSINYPVHPRQIEFARLNVNYTITSKRKLNQLIQEDYVSGWDDPRMPTLMGLRRRGYPPEAIRDFCNRIGVTKKNTIIDMNTLEECVRDHMNKHAKRAFCVLHPLKIIITNYPEDKEEILKAPIHPQNEDMGKRELPFSKEIYIDQDDFLEEAPKKFFRLSLEKEVRLRYSYIIRCDKVVKDESSGKIKELHCSYDEKTLGKKPEGRKVKGIIHWVSTKHAVPAEVRIYDRLFNVKDPQAEEKSGTSFKDIINNNSLIRKEKAVIEQSICNAKIEDQFQFERLGYFSVDKDSVSIKKLVFNRTVSLKETWNQTTN